MVGIGTLLAVFVIVYWSARWRGFDLRRRRWFLWLSVVSSPLAIMALEFGWTATELGRQPWTVWHVMRTREAASLNPGVWWTYAGILVIYIGMTIGAYIVLTSMGRRWRAGQENLPSPYGPPMVEAAP